MKKILTIISMTILILLFDKVNASTWGNHWANVYYDTQDNELQFNSSFDSLYQYRTLNSQNATSSYFRFSNAFNHQHGIVKISGYINSHEYLDDYVDLKCSNWHSDTNTCQNWYDTNNSKLTFQIWLNNRDNQCSVQFTNNKYDVDGYLFWEANCYLAPTSFDKVYYYMDFMGSGSQNVNFDLGINRTIHYEITDSQSIIENQNQNTQEIINQNATYSDTPTKDMTNETRELESYEQAEQNLINSLDLNMSVLDGITINPNASSYIWQIVNKLRTINPGIILLMTSILGMGIIKMVLNR